MVNRETLAKVYLDWVNNFLTLQKFAEYYGLYEDEALALVNLAQSCFENNHPEN